jgi:hypothetical protein
MNFNVFKQAVATQFAKMAKSPLFVTAITGDDLWAPNIRKPRDRKYYTTPNTNGLERH